MDPGGHTRRRQHIPASAPHDGVTAVRVGHFADARREFDPLSHGEVETVSVDHRAVRPELARRPHARRGAVGRFGVGYKSAACPAVSQSTTTNLLRPSDTAMLTSVSAPKILMYSSR